MFRLINAVWDAKSYKLFDKSFHIVISNVHIFFKRAFTPTELSINWFLALIYINLSEQEAKATDAWVQINQLIFERDCINKPEE